MNIIMRLIFLWAIVIISCQSPARFCFKVRFKSNCRNTSGINRSKCAAVLQINHCVGVSPKLSFPHNAADLNIIRLNEWLSLRKIAPQYLIVTVVTDALNQWKRKKALFVTCLCWAVRWSGGQEILRSMPASTILFWRWLHVLMFLHQCTRIKKIKERIQSQICC